MPKGFTLIEVLVIIIMIGIVASLGLVNFGRTKEEALDREAKDGLKLIQSAEKLYNLETMVGGTGSYIACANTSDINEKLKLSLPASNPSWQYRVRNDNITGNLTARARRMTSTNRRVWCIYFAPLDNDPFSNSNCSW